jgi:hypothetical protein
MLLELVGYEVDVAYDGPERVEKAPVQAYPTSATRYSLIGADTILAELTGLGAQATRSHRPCGKSPTRRWRGEIGALRASVTSTYERKPNCSARGDGHTCVSSRQSGKRGGHIDRGIHRH